MGDAGSRAMGIFIAIAVLKMHSPVYVPAGCCGTYRRRWSGLVKVSLLRFLKIHILKNTITPIHDHVRKKGWVVQCPGGISFCYHSDCNFTCSNLSGYDLSCSYNWRLYAFCFH